MDESLAVNNAYLEVRKAICHVGNVAGLRRMTTFPFALIRSTPRRDCDGNGDDETAID